MIKGSELMCAYRGGQLALSVLVDPTQEREAYELVDKLRDKELSVEVKQYREKRSLDANGYFWVLCGKVAQALILAGTNTSKEEIYQSYVKSVGGNFEALTIRENAVSSFCEQWAKGGLGCCTEILDSEYPGCKTVLAFFGSSTYDTAQMTAIINLVQADCKELGIPTDPPEVIERLLNLWNVKA